MHSMHAFYSDAFTGGCGMLLCAEAVELARLQQRGHEHFASALIVPAFNAQGPVSKVRGRNLLDVLRASSPQLRST